MLLTLEEKEYLLELLKKEKRRAWFKKLPAEHHKLVEKLEQMVRNEKINRQ